MQRASLPTAIAWHPALRWLASGWANGEVVLGRAEGRQNDTDVTIFKSLGMAVEDVVAADLVLRRAVETGTGTELTL